MEFTYEAKMLIVVTSENDVEPDRNELIESLQASVTLELDTEADGTTLSDGSEIVSLEIDWESCTSRSDWVRSATSSKLCAPIWSTMRAGMIHTARSPRPTIRTADCSTLCCRHISAANFQERSLTSLPCLGVAANKTPSDGGC